jgi:hypothetical protein
MIIADTSVWIDFLYQCRPDLWGMQEKGQNGQVYP